MRLTAVPGLAVCTCLRCAWLRAWLPRPVRRQSALGTREEDCSQREQQSTEQSGHRRVVLVAEVARLVLGEPEVSMQFAGLVGHLGDVVVDLAWRTPRSPTRGSSRRLACCR